MSVIMGFIILMMLAMLGYMFFRLSITRRFSVLSSICFQLLALTASILCFAGNVRTNNAIEAFYVFFGLVVPLIYLGLDYTVMIKRARDTGIIEGFTQTMESIPQIEPGKKFTKRFINGVLKEKQVPDVVRELNYNKEDVVKNIKNNLINAQLFINSMDYESAYEIYSSLVKIINTSAELYYNLGNICFYQNRFSEALFNYRKVLEVNVKSREDLTRSKEVLRIDLTFTDKRRNTKTQEDIDYSEHMVHFNMGNCYFRLNKLEQAVECYNRALSLNPGLIEGYENLAVCLVEQGKADEAVNYIRKVISDDPKNHRLNYSLGKLLIESREFTEAAAVLKEALKLKPDNMDCYEALGKALTESGNYREALDLYEKLMKKNRKDYNICYNLGTSYYKMGLFKEAVETLEKAVELNPENHRAYYNLAMVLEDQGRKDHAVQYFRKVLELKPEFSQAYNNLGVLLSTEGRYLEALKVFTEGLKKNPDEYSLFYNMALTLIDMGKKEEALDALRNAVELKPDDTESNLSLAGLLTNMKKYSDASDVVKKALKLKPQESELLYCYSTVLSLMRRSEQALENLKKAVELNKKYRDRAKAENAFDSLKNKAEFKELVS